MNISSLEEFLSIAQRAWQLQYPFIVNLIAPMQTLDIFFKKSVIAPHKESLVNTVRYYQEIQNQGFYPCWIDLAQKREDEEWQDLIGWLTYQQRPIVLILIGTLSEEALARECVRYYLSDRDAERVPATSGYPSGSLRTQLLESFQNDPKNTAFQPRFFISLLLDHIGAQSDPHTLAGPTSEILERVFLGLEGTMKDPSIFSRHIKWSLFQYLKALKEHQARAQAQ